MLKFRVGILALFLLCHESAFGDSRLPAVQIAAVIGSTVGALVTGNPLAATIDGLESMRLLKSLSVATGKTEKKNDKTTEKKSEDSPQAQTPEPNPVSTPSQNIPMNQSLYNHLPGQPLRSRNPFENGDDFFSRSKMGDEFPEPPDLSEKYPEACLIDDYGFPMPNQYNSGMCLQFASTSILEHFVHVVNKRPIHIDPWVMKNFGSADTARFTEEPLRLRRALIANHLLPKNIVVPEIKGDVLFAHNGRGDQDSGGLSQSEFEKLIDSLSQNEGPVLFEWRPHFPPGTPLREQYWHANVCLGFNLKKKILYCRDSAMGREGSYNGNSYRDIFEMPFSLAMSAGKHATVFSLASSESTLPMGRRDRIANENKPRPNCSKAGSDSIAGNFHEKNELASPSPAVHF
jgi:hypothetical protein